MKRLLFACIALVCAVGIASADQGNPKLASIEAIRFGPEGMLIVGGGSDVVTIETGDKTPITWSKTEIANIDGVLAGKLGTNAKDIEIRRIAVNPASKKLYVAVRSLKSNQYAILTVDGDGKVGEFALDNVKYEKYPLQVDKKAVTKITDVIHAGGKIVVATQATDQFKSRVFTILPGKAPTQFYTETFHTGHNKVETHAPILCLMAYEENSKVNIAGSFTCTPIVRYPLDDAQPETKVKGTTVVELGTGNTPRSMFPYEKDGKRYILINVGRNNKQPAFGMPSAYWVAKVDHTLLKETVNVNEKAPWRIGGKNTSVKLTDRVSVADQYYGTINMDQLDATRAVLVRDTGKGGRDLAVVVLP
jgi:hypothetical protein